MVHIKRLVIAGLVLIWGIAAFALGIKYETEQEQEKDSYSTQNMIAVVNADEGIDVDGIKVNYAAEFMSFPDVNFQTTGLIDAREGVTEGRYAAYIIIPNNFSKSVTSINGEPEKASIAYGIGTNLRPDIKEEVIQIFYENDIQKIFSIRKQKYINVLLSYEQAEIYNGDKLVIER